MNEQTKKLVETFTEQMQEKNIRFSFKDTFKQGVNHYISSLLFPDKKAILLHVKSKNKSLSLSLQFTPLTASFSEEEKAYILDLFSFWLTFNQIEKHDTFFVSTYGSNTFLKKETYKQWFDTHQFHHISKGALSFLNKHRLLDFTTEGFIILPNESPTAVALSYIETLEQTLVAFSNATPSLHLKKQLTIKKPIPFYYEGQNGEFSLEYIAGEYVISELHLKRAQKIENAEDISAFIRDTLGSISQKHRIRNLYKTRKYFYGKWTTMLEKKHHIHLPVKEVHECLLNHWSPNQIENLCAQEIKKETLLACSKKGYALFELGNHIFVTSKDVLYETTSDHIEEAFSRYESYILNDLQQEIHLQKQAILSQKKAAQ